MNPKTPFYLLLYRPATCKCWTPYACHDRPAGNFFANPKAALAYAKSQSALGYRIWLAGADMWTTLEFKVATVSIDSTTPDWPPANYHHPGPTPPIPGEAP